MQFVLRFAESAGGGDLVQAVPHRAGCGDARDASEPSARAPAGCIRLHKHRLPQGECLSVARVPRSASCVFSAYRGRSSILLVETDMFTLDALHESGRVGVSLVIQVGNDGYRLCVDIGPKSPEAEATVTWTPPSHFLLGCLPPCSPNPYPGGRCCLRGWYLPFAGMRSTRRTAWTTSSSSPLKGKLAAESRT